MNNLSDKSEVQEREQSLFEFVIERMGFAFFSGIAGLIYASVICVTLFLLKVNISTKPFLQSFMVFFALVGAILGDKVTPIIMSTIYGLMYLWGVVLGFVGYESSILPNEELFPKKSEYLWCAMLGVFAVVIYFFIK